MFKKSLLAAATLAASFNVLATTTVVTGTPVDYAKEIFGSNQSILNTVNQRLEIRNAVEVGAQADFTYTLSDGVFAADPTPAFGAGGGTGTATIIKVNGGLNSDSVTYRVTVTGAIAAPDVAFLDLTMVSVKELDTFAEADATLLLTPSISTVNIVPQQFVTTLIDGSDADDLDIATTSKGINFAATGEGAGGVVVDERTGFSVNGGFDATEFQLFQTVDITDTALAKARNGATDIALVAADTVTITVTGTFADDAEICINDEADCTTSVISTGTISGGTATFEIAGNAATGMSANLILIAGGDEEVPTGEFEIVAAVDFDDAGFADVSTLEETTPVTSELGFDGLQATTNRVNIITKPGAQDGTFIRVTNTSSEESVVFITVTLQDGSATVTGQLDSIPANATLVYTSEDISEAIGVETWSGRGNAVISTSAAPGDVVIVPLVRTSGVLTNQSGKL